MKISKLLQIFSKKLAAKYLLNLRCKNEAELGEIYAEFQKLTKDLKL